MSKCVDIVVVVCCLQDGVTELLAASSAQLCKCMVDRRSVAATPREESSDESTVISSQTSTLTRNQGRLSCCLFVTLVDFSL